MCTLVILRRPGHPWPVVIGANRDEMAERPWRPPGRHWADRPEVVAGLDLEAGGSWLGVNDHGVAAAVLNRRHSLGPAPGKRSRGELVLDALDHADAVAAAEALAELDPRAWRPFNLIVADDRDAYWIRGTGEAGPPVVGVRPVPEGVSMIASDDLNDTGHPRLARYLPLFRAAAAPEPDRADYAAWEALLSSADPEPEAGATAAMSFRLDSGYGTSSASLIALPSTAAAEPPRPVWRFAYGRPDTAPFRPLDLGPPALPPLEAPEEPERP